MVYALTQQSLRYLVQKGFYDIEKKLSKEGVICDYKIRLSQLLISNGWNIRCLLPEYNLIDYRRAHNDINPTSTQSDPSFAFSYFGRTVHPLETIFIKTNRDLVCQKYLDRRCRPTKKLPNELEKVYFEHQAPLKELIMRQIRALLPRPNGF